MGRNRETVLYYTPESTKKTAKLKAVLIQMGVRIKNIGACQVGERVGYLAGMDGYEKNEIGEALPLISQEVLVMKDFSSRRMDELFLRIRKAGIPKIDLKAVITATNAGWTFYQLYEEILAEHRQMENQNAPFHGDNDNSLSG